jgi:cystathionine gamma-synthase
MFLEERMSQTTFLTNNLLPQCRLMLNPVSRFYPKFKTHMDATYEDSLFDNDALILEMNSRELVDRTAVTNRSAEKLSDMLYARSVVGGSQGSIVHAVHYPKYRTREHFDQCRNPLAIQAGLDGTGYGCLLSVVFTSVESAKAFYSALQCYRGTTFGTVYTVVTAFSAGAFPPSKMKWAEEHGVEESLVRLIPRRRSSGYSRIREGPVQCRYGRHVQSLEMRFRRVAGCRKCC